MQKNERNNEGRQCFLSRTEHGKLEKKQKASA